MNRYYSENEIIFLNGESFQIKEIIGRGASSVVYYAINLSDGTEHLLKEFNPKGIEMWRDEMGVLHLEKESDTQRHREGLERIKSAYELQCSFRKDPALKNVTSNIQGCFNEHGTFYVDMTCFAGQSYDKIKETSLANLIHRIKAIAGVVAAYHERGYLYLDIKPENIFTIPQTCDLVMFFDFDSVIRKKDLLRPNPHLAYTKKWAPPELTNPGRAQYIAECTDIYSLGMVFFYKLTGRFPTLEEHRSNAEYACIRTSELLSDTSDEAVMLISDIFRHTLCLDPRKRWQDAQSLIDALDHLLKNVNKTSEGSKGQKHGRSNSTGVIVGVVAAILITALGVGMFLLGSRHNSSRNDLARETAVPTEDPPKHIEEQNVQTGSVVDVAPDINTADSHSENDTQSAIPTDDMQNATFEYSINTVALNNFQSMVITNSGVIYYLADYVLCRSDAEYVLDCSDSICRFGEKGYLHYAPENDRVYLISGEHISVYDVTDILNPQKLFFSYDGEQITGDGVYLSEPVSTYPDGSLFIRGYRIELDTTYITRVTLPFYTYQSGYRKAVGSNIVECEPGGSEIIVYPLTNQSPYTVQLEGALYANAEVFASQEGLILFEDNVGICQYDLSGKKTVLIPATAIRVDDYQMLSPCYYTFITCNGLDQIAWYDDSQHSIRYLSRVNR